MPPWTRLLGGGIAVDTPPEQARRIRVTNQMALTNIPIALVFVPILGWLDAPLAALGVLAVGVCYGLVYLVNVRGDQDRARFFLVLCMNLSIGLFAVIVGHESKVELLFLGALCVPFALFVRQERLRWIIAISLPIALYCVVELCHVVLDVPAILSVEHQRVIAVPVTAALFLDMVTRLKFLHDAHTESEARLVEARDAALAGSRAKSIFLANMSHEIRTPLNGVLGMTTLALDTDLTPEQRDYLETAQTSARDLLGLLNDILDLSKVEAGRLDIERVPFDLDELLAECLRPLAARANERGTELVCFTDPATPRRVSGDPLRLRQVLVNLVSNAVKFTEGGEVVVRVAPRGDHLEVSVADTGIGIAEDQLENIFEVFTQADGSTTRKYGGTGLGLSISRDIVRLLGGDIRVESELGTGSTFTFTVPLEPVDEVGDPRLLPPDGPERRALVVVDHATQRRAVAELLEGAGFTVTSCDDVAAARASLEEARAAPFDVALVDARLVDARGAALLDTERGAHEGEPTRFVLLAHIGDGALAGRWREAGFSARLTKPLVRASLVPVLAQVMTRAAGGAAPLASSHRGQRHPTRPLSVLIAEDTRINQVVLLKIVETAGHWATLVDNGLAAVRAVEESTFDLVLMDVQMPDLDGLEATRRIREAEAARGAAPVPIVALTAHSMRGDAERCLEAGATAYLSKPVNVEQLVELLHHLATERADTVAAVAKEEKLVGLG